MSLSPSIPPAGWRGEGLDFGGHRLVVTGASSGLGAALALALGQAGAEVVLSGRHLPRLEGIYDRIIAAGGPEPMLAPLDLERATADDYQAFAEAIAASGPALFGLVHCAAHLGALMGLPRYEPLQWARVHQVNLHAAFLLTQSLLPMLLQSPRATVIFTSDSVARESRSFWGAYAVSKAAVDGLAGLLAADLQGYPGFHCHALDPAPRPTRLRSQAYPAETATALGPLDEAVAAYLYLLTRGADERLPVRQQAATSGSLRPLTGTALAD
jgi:NAD(P)-dependent dehydrogenase (short-subunit alcohol dehydrogenase family)